MRETVTLNEHVLVRLSESVAVQLTCVLPIGKFWPDSGVHDTVTVPWPPVADGVSNVMAMPLAFTVERDSPSPHDNDGASATGGGVTTGGSGVGDTGVFVHEATVTAKAMNIARGERVAHCVTSLIYVN
jgi:hypothetical protein